MNLLLLFLILLSCGLFVSYYMQNVILFLGIFLMVPILFSVRYFYDNGIPRFTLKKKFSFQVIKIKKSNSDTVNETLLSISFFRKICNSFSKEYEKGIESSGVSKSLVDVSIKNLKMIIITFVFSVIVSVVLYVTLGSVVSFVLLVMPLIIFLLNIFELRTPTTQRKNGVEKELWSFSIFCDIMDNTQSKMYNVFTSIVQDDSELFPFMKKEGLILQRDVMGFGDSAFNSLKNLASVHPSKLFSEFIQGYLTSQSVGGKETGDYIAEKSREYATILKQKMASYIETSDSISQMVSFGLIMYPIMVVLSSTMTSGDNLLLLITFGFVFIPIMIVILIKKIESMTPFSSDEIPFLKIPIILAILVLIIGIVLELNYWEIVIFPLIVWCVSNYTMIRKRLLVNSNTDKSIPRFVRDMNQAMLSGSSFFESFVFVQESASYTDEMNGILKRIRKDVILGEQLDESMLKIHTPSWLSNFIIKIISFTGKSGEITPEIMEKLAVFSNNFIESKTEISNKTGISVVLSYFGSLIVILLVLVIPSVSIGEMTEVIEEIDEVNLDETLTSLNIVLVIIVSFSSMVLVSKIRYGTIRHSLNGGIVLIIICVILYYDRIVGLSFT